MADSCAACKFFKVAADPAWGRCHIEAPAADNFWPQVNAADWCGEFKVGQAPLLAGEWVPMQATDSYGNPV